MVKKLFLFLFIATLTSCGSSKSKIQTTKKPVGWKYSKPIQNGNTGKTISQPSQAVSKPMSTNEAVKGYIAQYNQVAMGNMNTYGIPASIILAQGILESGAGQSDLAKNANNHFGIKCHNDWTGDKVYKDDDSANECFRKYDQVSESYRDHAMVLTGKKRYANLFTLAKGDYKAWAKGLREAGYATDPRYPEKLIGYIETYNLHEYDNKVLGKKSKKEETKVLVNDDFSTPKSDWYEIQKGDTFYSVSRKFNLTVEELKQKNNLSDNTLSIGQKLKVK
ncbi:glucosaminidase domain-containing protein [Flavobacterium adhaerens]|uniref:glucosaminidase domain-containing protein n=1 Tax=Flavobacterium adhaerens TaxID=3149043 RepID=UPI0032B4792C